MNRCARILSFYASDTAGVCSMLYELGGMTVVHDASGCNSTYATHDEPRWASRESMVYISALTEMDAILGGDAKLADDVVRAARELRPRFIALCGSPMPFMTGVDFPALAREIGQVCGIPALGIATNGMHSYIKGASDALVAYLARFCGREAKPSGRLSVNILGATPLDFSITGMVPSMIRLLTENGFAVQACMAMGSTPEAIAQAGAARVNLVVSRAGLAAAEWLRQTFGTPYVAGVPFGREFSRKVLSALRQSAGDGENRMPCADRRTPETGGSAVVGESIAAASLAAALGAPARVLAPESLDPVFLVPGDRILRDEDDAEAAFAASSAVIADPMYEPVSPPDIPFRRLPHEAFSGRCYRHAIPDLIGKEFPC